MDRNTTLANAAMSLLDDICKSLKATADKGESDERYAIAVNKGAINPDLSTITGTGAWYCSDNNGNITDWDEEVATMMKKIFGDFVAQYCSSANGDFLEVAQRCWAEVCSRFTSYGGSQIPPKGSTIDCSAYVTWVAYEYGYTELAGWQKCTWDWCINNQWASKYGWEFIDISTWSSDQVLQQLQPGDIVVRDSNASYNQAGVNHMNIVAEIQGNKVLCYDCGSSSNWKGKNGQPIDKTNFVLYTSTKYAKIIRITPP